MEEISFLQYILPKNIYMAVQLIVGTVIALLFLYKVMRYLKREIGDIKETHKKINVIFGELTPNHGSSIKDKITKMDNQLSDNTNLTIKIFDRQRWILDNENIIVFESDNEGKCIWVNKKYCDWMDREPRYFLGTGWKNAIHPDDRDRIGEEWESAVKDGRDSENYYKMVDKSGNIYNVHCVANKSADKNGYMGSITIVNKQNS